LIFSYKIHGGSPHKDKIRQIELVTEIPFVLRMAYPLMRPVSSRKNKGIRLPKKIIEES